MVNQGLYYVYAALPLLLWGYTVMGKPTGNTIRNLWICYIILGALGGFMGYF